MLVLYLVTVYIGYWPLFLAIPFFWWFLPFLDRQFGSQKFWDKAIWLACFLCALVVIAIVNVLWLVHK